MANVLEQLHTDHRNMARLLEVLKDQLASLRRGESTDFDLMHDIMRYMRNYPDFAHHPKEELMFERLIQHDEGAREPISKLSKEHHTLAEKGETVLDLLRHVIDGALTSREDLVRSGQDYVELLWEHMRLEEDDVFPRAKNLLTREELDAVAEAYAEQLDPVFGPSIQEDFRSLYNHIQGETPDSK